jgi:hypothetical protein
MQVKFIQEFFAEWHHRGSLIASATVNKMANPQPVFGIAKSELNVFSNKRERPVSIYLAYERSPRIHSR